MSMAKKSVKPHGFYKTLERLAHETRYHIDNVYYSYDLSKVHGKRQTRLLSAMPDSTMVELLALRHDLNKLFRGVAKTTKNSS